MLSPIIRDVSPSPKSRFSPPKKVKEPKRRFEAQDNETEDEEESQEYISETKNHTQLQRRQPSPTSPERRVQKAPATKKKANFKKPEPPQEPPKKPHKEHRSFLLAVHVLIALFVVDTVFPRLKSQKKDAEILAKKHKLKQERNVARSHKQLDEKKELRRLREERAKFQQQFQEQHYLRNEKARNARQYVGSPPEHRQHHPDFQGRGRHGRGRYWDEDRDVDGHQRRGTSLPVPRSEFASNSTIGVEPVLSMKGLGDIYGMNDRGDVIVISHSQTANFLGNNSTFSAGETRTISRKTKTTSSEKARETDDKVVHLGLFVALLGLLSFVV